MPLADPASALAARSADVDARIAAAYSKYLEAEFPAGAALLAVGGYGRRELFPYSDIDLLLLRSAEPTPAQRDAFSRMLSDLWDQGLRVSQSVRPVSECLQIIEGNTELAISLLDQRLLLGDTELYSQLIEALPAFYGKHRRALGERLVRLTRTRHAKFHNTIYHLEPDLKEGPGGLRDLHVLRWLNRLSGTELPEGIAESQAFLFAVRTALHELQRRDANVLTFELQDRLSHSPLAWDDPAAGMRRFYRQARRIFSPLAKSLEQIESRTATLADRLRDWRTRLSTSEFTVSRDQVFLRSPGQLGLDPMLALRLFTFVARHGLPLAPDTTRRLQQDSSPAPSVDWSRHIEPLLSLPHAVMAIRAMQECGWWTRLLPEWDHIDCLVVRDFYHRYTVDEHTMVALEAIDELGGETSTSKRLSTLLSEIDSLAPLRLALLLHDIGKGYGGQSHALVSEEKAAAILARWQVPDATRSLVLFLIERHLELSSVMTSRNLDDPATVRQVAGRIGTIERLKYLALLTHADISAVNPGAMTPWRVEQLWHAYVATFRELTRELDTDRIAASSPELAEFLLGFPTRYERTHTAAEIASHQHLAQQSQEKGVALKIGKERGGYHLTLAAHDRPALLASVAGALASFGLNILKAEAFANQRGLVLDTFQFVDPMRTLELNPPEMQRLESTLEQAVLGKVNVEKLLRGRASVKKAPSPVRASVTLDQDASDHATLFEIVAADRPGLLYDLASAITAAGGSIEVVLLDTEAHRAIDVFYVTAGGKKLPQAEAEALREQLQASCG